MTNFNKSLLSFNEGREKGPGFEELIKWYFENSNLYKDIITKVWLWDDWPNKWGRDKGIDIVAKTKDGSYWAIQTKDYDQNYYIKKQDVDSFLSESNRKVFNYRLLVSSNNLLGSNAREAINGQEKPVGLILGSDLISEDLIWPKYKDKRQILKSFKKFKPKPHQKKAILNVSQSFKTSDKGKLIMACGTGKTLTSLWINESLNSNLTVVFVPSISLLKQTIKPWLLHKNKQFSFITVCSDKTVEDKDSYDTLNEDTSSLGVPTTTNPNIISNFMRKNGRKVIFSTYQSSHAILLAQKKSKKTLDLMICDEAHRLTGGRSIISNNVLGETSIRAKKQLFMTATPKIVNQQLKKLAQDKEYETYSMDDEKLFGNELYRLSFGEAIKKKLLVDYEILVFTILDSDVKKIINQNKTVHSKDKSISSYSFATQIALAKASKKFKIKKIITFHNRVKNAKDYALTMMENKELLFNKNKKIYTSFVSGEMTADLREKELQKLDEESFDFSLVSNARCLSEGIDVPALDAVAFIDPRRSIIDIVQAIGRAIRTSKNKEKGYIFLPIVISEDEELSQQISDTSFSQIGKVLQALKAHDETLVEELKNIRVNEILYGKTSRLSKLTIDIPINLPKSFAQNINTNIITDLNDNWYTYFELMVEYYRLNKSSYIPVKETYKGKKLGKWAERQRYNKQLLAIDKVDLIEKTFSDWVWNRPDHELEIHIRDWKNYISKHKDMYINPKYDKKTATWLRNQNKQFRNNNINEVVKNRILNEFPNYDFINYKDKMWLRQLDEYKQLINIYGISNVTEGKIEDFKGKYIKKDFLHYIRSKFNNGTLQDWKYEIIVKEIPDFIWSVDEANKQYKRSIFEQYVKENKTAYLYRDTVYKGENLGNWASLIRQKYSEGNLSEEEIEYFNKFLSKGWVYSNKDVIENKKKNKIIEVNNKFYKSFNELNEFYKAKKSTIVLEAENPKLAAWVSRMRREGNSNKLNLEIKDLFEDTFSDWFWGGLWEYEFRKNLNIVMKYNDKYGLPAKDNERYDGLDINVWVRTQRNKYNNKKLSKEKILALKKIDQDFFSQKSSIKKSLSTNKRIEENMKHDLEKFITFVEKNGWPKHDDVINDWYPLRYVWSKRAQNRKNKLDEKFIDLINKKLSKLDNSFPDKFWNS